MRFDVITLFPDFYQAFHVSQIWKKAEERERFQVNLHDLRDFTDDKHRTVDDVPFGGGPGMVMKVEPLVRALESLPDDPGRIVLCTSPQGRRLTQDWVAQLVERPQVVIISGRYEGVDERFIEGWVDECFSIGDYILSGGDLPAMVLMESMVRLIPGVVGDQESIASDSFTSGKLKFPQYTRPASFRGKEVPEVLRSGDHQAIAHWREQESLRRTRERRPELLQSTFNE